MTVREPVMPWRTRQGRRLLYAVATLVISIVLIGFAIQQSLYQRSLDERDANQNAYVDCLQRWADDITDTLQTRTSASTALDRIERRMERAERHEQDVIADVILIVGRLRQVPPEATIRQLDRVLNGFPALAERVRVARADVREARSDARETRQQNPYTPPRLACSEGVDATGPTGG